MIGILTQRESEVFVRYVSRKFIGRVKVIWKFVCGGLLLFNVSDPLRIGIY
jgi:hypothetical protein